MVDLPLCREQFKRMRSELLSSSSFCQPSGWIPILRANRVRSKRSNRRATLPTATLSFQLCQWSKGIDDGELRLGELLQRSGYGPVSLIRDMHRNNLWSAVYDLTHSRYQLDIRPLLPDGLKDRPVVGIVLFLKDL